MSKMSVTREELRKAEAVRKAAATIEANKHLTEDEENAKLDAWAAPILKRASKRRRLEIEAEYSRLSTEQCSRKLTEGEETLLKICWEKMLGYPRRR